MGLPGNAGKTGASGDRGIRGKRVKFHAPKHDIAC